MRIWPDDSQQELFTLDISCQIFWTLSSSSMYFFSVSILNRITAFRLQLPSLFDFTCVIPVILVCLIIRHYSKFNIGCGSSVWLDYRLYCNDCFNQEPTPNVSMAFTFVFKVLNSKTTIIAISSKQYAWYVGV